MTCRLQGIAAAAAASGLFLAAGAWAQDAVPQATVEPLPTGEAPVGQYAAPTLLEDIDAEEERTLDEMFVGLEVKTLERRVDELELVVEQMAARLVAMERAQSAASE